MPLNHNSPASIREFLESRAIAPRKRWGQNFLISTEVRKKIIELLQISPGSRVWEIGAGLGAMSQDLLECGADLSAFEIDPAYCRWLRESFEGQRFHLVEGNVCDTWKSEWQKAKPQRIMGNLPYNISLSFIRVLVENNQLTERCVFTVQKEVKERIMSQPGSKNYSPLAVFCQIYSRIQDGGAISPACFYPVPRVQSRIIVMQSSRPFGDVRSPETLKIIVCTLFASRRKTLSNNLKSAGKIPDFPDENRVREACRQLGIDLQRRPESLSPKDWLDMANCLS